MRGTRHAALTRPRPGFRGVFGRAGVPNLILVRRSSPTARRQEAADTIGQEEAGPETATKRSAASDERAQSRSDDAAVYK